ncbi:MAG: DUF4389 domain-containing protein [Dehalococcoidales bacterium]|nr:DUF4389 domain-containing protein [Dehalococcoidales bacterium]
MSKYPVDIKGDLSKPPHGAWFLIKWLLMIPHLFCLCFLSIAFIFVCIIAFFSILFSGKYPEGLFKFNTGVLRWYWRVSFYSYGALATDKYPPFSLQPDKDFPADITIQYPKKLSNGLVLVKWWLLAIPHYCVIGAFSGSWGRGGLNLISVLSVFAAIVVLFKDKYPTDFFKLVMGFNRWVFRVGAYVSLMTDEYPPFRLWDD